MVSNNWLRFVLAQIDFALIARSPNFPTPPINQDPTRKKIILKIQIDTVPPH